MELFEILLALERDKITNIYDKIWNPFKYIHCNQGSNFVRVVKFESNLKLYYTEDIYCKSDENIRVINYKCN